MDVDELQHLPVLLEEVTAALNIREDGMYVDATYGRGGHAAAILKRLGPQGRLLALDRDPQAVAAARRRFPDDARFTVVQGRFGLFGQAIAQAGWAGKVQGILLDIGVSSPQLEDRTRGFSFKHDGPLDMRMDPTTGDSAAQWLNSADASAIEQVLRTLGEERFARRIAGAIVRERAAAPITTTGRLAQIIAAAVPTREPGKDPATRSFQAIRMQVNQELEELQAALPQALDALAPGGRLAVISFHSLEDRIVKNFMRDEARGDPFPTKLPILSARLTPRLRRLGKAQRPSAAEVARNPRARSAVLRVAERVGASSP